MELSFAFSSLSAVFRSANAKGIAEVSPRRHNGEVTDEDVRFAGVDEN